MQSPCEGTHTTFLYDEGGHDVSEESRITGLLERAENDVWLVPAIALQRSVDDDQSENRQPNAPSKTHVLNVASAVERLNISSRSSSRSQMTNGLASQCGSAGCVSHLVTDQTPSRIIG